MKKLGKVFKGAYEIVTQNDYRERYKKISGYDPMKCHHCGGEMGLWKIWHPKHGYIYDESENIKVGRYDFSPGQSNSGERRCTVRSSSRGVPLPLFPVPA